MKVAAHKERFRSMQRKMAGSSKLVSVLVLVLVLICVIVLAATKICSAFDLGTTALGFLQLQGILRSPCCENPPTLNSSYGAGHVEEIGGLKCYVAGSANSKFAVILVSDVYGYEVPHLRMIADKVTAAAGFYVLVPDFFHGDPYVDNDPQRDFTVWKSKHTEEQGANDAKSLIKAIKSKGVVQVGVAGFCWGGKVAVELAKSRKYIKVAVILHPSDVVVDDMKEVKVPFSVLGAELDSNLPPSMMREFEAPLEANKNVDDSFVKIYPGVKHGWTLWYNDTDAVAVKNANEAHQDMLNWFLKHF